MSKESIPLQQDMFTGALVDNRTRSQKQTTGLQQLPMFSLRETFEFGARIRPYLANAPRPTLELISEDTRTPEEIEQDLMRESQRHMLLIPGLGISDVSNLNGAQSNTAFLVGEESVPQKFRLNNGNTPLAQGQSVYTNPDNLLVSPAVIPIEATGDENVDEEVNEAVFPLAAPLAKYVAYLELIQIVEERTAIRSQSATASLAETILMSLAQLAAKQAGLTETEIQMATTIGLFRGKSETKQINIPISGTELKDADIPILWLNRSHLIQGRPDLAAIIQKLGKHEIEFIAKKVGEALEEFYWIQLNVVLSLLIDYDCNIANQAAEITSD